ncbi:hypothetical protein SO3561_10382 [Streptomyces olivochromogenes]|uniref:Uncharacterized protein n=1 Tax=Streptomyces olivochromogenes TaxID=1963 RepID=A0A286PGX8_STROL|nr:hypothetical protein SO3561_10382 [Streptomyces olivochromogenes]
MQPYELSLAALGRPLGEPVLPRVGHAHEQTQPARRSAAV